ncbi:MAG: hypothetical protein JNK50_14290 [Bacteroidia bacterium]|nr:hypothetical protein [Bacteroidia bacterium]
MTASEILKEFGGYASKISFRLYNEDIIDILDYERLNIIINEYKKERGKDAHPEMTAEFAYKLNHILDD